LAASPNGLTPTLHESAADAVEFKRGVRFGHVGVKFESSDEAFRLYNSLNHLLFNPVLPYYLQTKKPTTDDPFQGADRMAGNSYRLSDLETIGPKKRKEEDIRLNNIPV
jgi:hypothetical protein